jgi:tetratricopeptide (TPR) repeat protein
LTSKERQVKPGRNDPCPCGSGEKYKKCCGTAAVKVHASGATVPKHELEESQGGAAETRLAALFNARRYDEMELSARELLMRHPDTGFAWKALSVCLWAQAKDARQALEKAAVLLPDDAEVHSNLGHALFQAGELDRSVHSCRRALAIDPNFAEAHSNLGNALGALGRLNDALASYRRALDIRPGFAIVHNNMGNALRALGQLQDAVASYRQALTIRPAFAEAHNNLGNALRALGLFNDAVASYRQALAISPTFAEAHSNLGNALLDLGQHDDALASYRRALDLNADYAEAHNNLGNAFRSLEQFDAAAASCRRALVLKPDYAEAHNNLGNALRGLGQLEDSAASYRRALSLKPAYAEAHSNLGNALLDLWRLEEAVASYRQAIAIKPDYAEAHCKLGNALLQWWQLEAAVESCRHALAINPDYAEAHCSLGNALLELGELDQAEASYRRAIVLKPDDAEAYSGLGFALRRQSRTVEAEASCARALEINPDLSAALALLAELRADRGHFSEAELLFRRLAVLEPDLPAPWVGIASLRKMKAADAAWLTEVQRIAQKRLPPRQEVHLHYAIGKYFDDRQDFERAYLNYQRANELTKLHTPKKYDRLEFTRAIDRIVRLYDLAWASGTPIGPNTSSRPVFIVGMPRSGTTLAEQILASHPAVFGAGELGFWTTALTAPDASDVSGGKGDGAENTLADDYLRLLATLSAGAVRIVDKMPANFMALGLIHESLPNARIIHMRRNPMDTCLSIYFQNFATAHPYASDLDDLAHYYAEYSRLMRHWRTTLPEGTLLEVSYEALVDDQEGWSRKMLQFIGLPWDPRCIDFHRTDRPVVTASRSQVRQKMTRASVERWRRYEKFIGPLRHLTALS